MGKSSKKKAAKRAKTIAKTMTTMAAVKDEGRLEGGDTYVVYINWDGFAKYYYDYASAHGKTPVIDVLIKRGVVFNNAYTGVPSITVPMQTAIVSGAYTNATGNVGRYYDKSKNIVVQMRYTNNAETIAEAISRKGLNTAAINQFTLQNRGTSDNDPKNLYISVDCDKSKNQYNDYSARFDEAIKLIKGEIQLNGTKIDEIPRFLAIYIDDLDGIGHNMESTYGIAVVNTEEDRLTNVVTRLNLMDKKLGEFIKACMEKGVYDDMTFVLTTDHGMAPYGKQKRIGGNYQTKLLDVVNSLKKAGFNSQVLFEGEKPNADTDVVIVTYGLELQISFTKKYTEDNVIKIINAMKDKKYVGKIMKKEEMAARGCMDGFADLIISPKPPYSFKTGFAYQTARGQHDSLDEKAQHIFSIMWGKRVKTGFKYDEKMHNIDFATTMAYLLGISGPKNATGNVLHGALDK